jgi:nitrogen fixation/metabolism regulation signal transduction histidine kinase
MTEYAYAIQSVGEVSLKMPGDVSYYRDKIGSMLEETNRLTQLVHSLLTMARADSGRVQLHRIEVNLFDLAEETVGLLEVLAEEKQQSILIDGERSISVTADRTILRQAIVNLLHNAVKYSPWHLQTTRNREKENRRREEQPKIAMHEADGFERCCKFHFEVATSQILGPCRAPNADSEEHTWSCVLLCCSKT